MSKPKRVKHHVFVPSCKWRVLSTISECGNWRGVSARDRRGADSQYRDHVGSVEQAERASKRRGGAAPTPRRTTPVDQLPPDLTGA